MELFAMLVGAYLVGRISYNAAAEWSHFPRPPMSMESEDGAEPE